MRYPLGVGEWIRRRNGILPKPEKRSKNAARTPSRVHAVLGGFMERKTLHVKQTTYPSFYAYFSSVMIALGILPIRLFRSVTKPSISEATVG